MERLRRIRKRQKTGELIAISGADPFNVLGVIFPGKKVPNLANNRILLQDGIPIAVLESKEVKYLKDIAPDQEWTLRQALVRRSFPRMQRAHLGKKHREMQGI